MARFLQQIKSVANVFQSR
jgi:hypothetical protein